jgi:hypothetical protein
MQKKKKKKKKINSKGDMSTRNIYDHDILSRVKIFKLLNYTNVKINLYNTTLFLTLI